MSFGDTPLILEAWATVLGCTVFSFSLASKLIDLICE
jgi:hypothetical protein